MIVFCEECGEMFILDDGTETREIEFPCSKCRDTVRVSLPPKKEERAGEP